MAKFDVDVQGVTYEVDAPDERTAWAWANYTHKEKDKSQLAQQEDSQKYDPAAGMSALERGLVGAGGAMRNAYLGVRSMVPGLGLTKDEKDEIALYEKNKKGLGTAGTVGEIGADIAMTAAPSVWGAKALQGVAKVLPRATQFLSGSLPSNMLSSAAVSAATAPENRLSSAAGGALGAGAGEAAGRVLTKTLGGVVSDAVTPEARALIDQGINVPMWKSTENKIVRDLAERARVLPFAGNVIRQQERAAIEGFNKNMAAKATPPAPVLDDAGNVLRWETKPVREVGSEALNTLRSRFDDAYGALYKGRGIPVDNVYGQELSGILNNTQAYFPRISQDVAAAAKQVDDILREGTKSQSVTSKVLDASGRPIVQQKLGHAATSPESVKQAIYEIEKRIKSAYERKDFDAADAFKSIRSALDDLRMRGLPPEVADQASVINRAYATFKQLQRATGSLGAQTQGVVTPRQMLSAIKAGDKSPGKSAFARQRALNQAEALRAEQVLGSRLPEVGPGTAEKLAPLIMFGAPMLMGDMGATALLGTQTGQRFLQGGLGKASLLGLPIYPSQAAIRKYGSEYLVPALRAYGLAYGND